MTVVGYHILFMTSLVLRVASAYFAWRVSEPNAHTAQHVMLQLIGATPMRFLRFPLGLYRDMNGGNTPAPLNNSERPPRAADEVAAGRSDVWLFPATLTSGCDTALAFFWPRHFCSSPRFAATCASLP